VPVVSTKLKSLAPVPVAWRGFERSRRGEQKRGMETRHLGVDHVSSTGVSCELDIPEERIVRCKGQRSAEEERGELPHGGRRSRTDNTSRACAVGLIYPWGWPNLCGRERTARGSQICLNCVTGRNTVMQSRHYKPITRSNARATHPSVHSEWFLLTSPTCAFKPSRVVSFTYDLLCWCLSLLANLAASLNLP